MPARSKICQLPREIREEFEKRLISGGFADYEGLSAWLKEQGFEISRASAHRYGQEFQAKLAAIKIATEQARAIAEAVGDEEGVMGDALTRLCQEKAFQVLLKMQEEEIAQNMYLPHLGRMVAELNKSSVAQKKWMAEAKEKAKTTAEDVAKAARSGGLSEEKAEEIRKKILGIL